MMQRQGLNKKALERQAELAKKRGLKHEDMKGRLQKWVTNISSRSGGERTFIIYNNFLFIFTPDYKKVITVLRVPANLLRLAAIQTDKIRKERQSKQKKGRRYEKLK